MTGRDKNVGQVGYYWVDMIKAGSLDSKESAWNAGDLGSILRLGRSPGEENGYPFQYSCLGNQRTEKLGRLQSMGSQRVRHDWATKTFIFHFHEKAYAFMLSCFRRVLWNSFRISFDVGWLGFPVNPWVWLLLALGLLFKEATKWPLSVGPKQSC